MPPPNRPGPGGPPQADLTPAERLVQLRGARAALNTAIGSDDDFDAIQAARKAADEQALENAVKNRQAMKDRLVQLDEQIEELNAS